MWMVFNHRVKQWDLNWGCGWIGAQNLGLGTSAAGTSGSATWQRPANSGPAGLAWVGQRKLSNFRSNNWGYNPGVGNIGLANTGTGRGSGLWSATTRPASAASPGSGNIGLFHSGHPAMAFNTGTGKFSDCSLVVSTRHR